MICLRAGRWHRHELVPLTQPKANTRNVVFFDYAVKEKVNVAAVKPWSYGCTWEVC